MLLHDDDDYLSRIRPGAKSFYKCNIREELYHQVRRIESRFPGLITDRILLHDLSKLGPIMSSDYKLNAADVFDGAATFVNLGREQRKSVSMLDILKI